MSLTMAGEKKGKTGISKGKPVQRYGVVLSLPEILMDRLDEPKVGLRVVLCLGRR